MILTITDTAGIQSYIFGSNRLRENIGASYLVATATEDWARACAEEAQPGATLYAGGGNFVALFDDSTKADAYERAITRKALCEAPGLRVVVARADHDPQNDALAETLRAAFEDLGRRKSEAPRSVPLLGLSVTRQCASTGLPAVGYWGIDRPDQYAASAETLAKVDAVEPAKDRLERAFQDYLSDWDFAFPDDFDDLGGTRDDQRYIAVVHADGDGLGQRLMAIADTFAQAPAENDGCRKVLKKFSETVGEAARDALGAALKAVVGTYGFEEGEGGRRCFRSLVSEDAPVIYPAVEKKTGRTLLPVRPLVFGGDDVTLVCDGRLGVALAAHYLRAFARETAKRAEDLGGAGLTASAGVAIVKTRFPFARAYALSEALARSAKHRRREMDPNGTRGLCGLDWHIATSGLQGDLEEIRAREYADISGETLVQRPLLLQPLPADAAEPLEAADDWDAVEGTIRRFQAPEWSERRNKVKDLREVLRQGTGALDKFRKLHPISDADLVGWAHGGKPCLLFDAIEAADFHFPLAADGEDENKEAPAG